MATEASIVTKKRGAAYVCEGCGSAYLTRGEAETCEGKHTLFRRWEKGEVDDLEVAEGLGLPVDTPHDKEVSLRSVRNMLQGGADTSLKADTMKGAVMREAPPVLVAVTKLHGDGRVQVPVAVRNIWGVGDGDFVFWYRQGDAILLGPSHTEAPHRQPHYTYKGKEPSPP